MDALTQTGWFVVFGEYIVKSTFALGTALLIVFFLRKRSASLRHFVLSLFLVGLLLIPLLSSLPVGWETDLLPQRPARNGLAGDAELSTKVRYDLRWSAAEGNAPNVHIPAAGSIEVSEESSNNRGVAAIGPGSRILGTALPAVWAAGLLFLLLRLALGLAGAFRMTRDGKPVEDPRWQSLLRRFLAAIRLRRPISLKSHEDVAVPLTWGLVKPVILLPDDTERWTEDQCSSALCHELSHVKRGDFLVMMLVRLSLAVFWFNPLSWLVFGAMKKEQEKSCDELVIRSGIKPSTYAANLLLFRRSAGFRWNPSVALLGLFSRSRLNERLVAILKQKLSFKEVKMRTKILLSLTIILAVGLIGMARPSAGVAEKASVSTVSGPVVADIIPWAAGELQETAAVSVTAEQERREIEEAQAIEVAEQAEQEAKEKEEQEQGKEEQEQEKEKEKEKAKLHTIIITGKDGKKIPIEIAIVGGEEAKTVWIGKSITLKEGPEGKILILNPEGKELKVLKGEPYRLAIEAGDIKVLKEGDAIEIKEGEAVKLDKAVPFALKKEEGDVTLYFIDGKDIKLIKGDKDDEGIQVILKSGEEGEPHITWVGKDIAADITEKIHAKIGDIHEHLEALEVVSEVDLGKAIAEANVAVHIDEEKIQEIAKKIEHTKAVPYVTVSIDKEEIKKKLEEALKNLSKALEKQGKEREEMLRALEESLKEMQKRLEERSDKLKEAVKLHVDVAPKTWTIAKPVEGEEGLVTGIFIGKEDTEVGPIITVKTGKNGKFSMAYAMNIGENSREVYERTVARLKKELPEGYTLEPKFDEDSGTITLKITGPSDLDGAPPDLVKKLVEIIKEEIKK